MLVLTRGPNDKVVFPTLGITVEILRVTGNKVKLGIDAPQEIPVHRHEISQQIVADVAGESPETLKFPAKNDSPSANLDHATRNRLNCAALGLHYLHRMLEVGELGDAEATIFKIFNELKAIESDLDDNPAKHEPPPTTETAPHPRALLVEDNDNERELLAGYFRPNGFDVETAVDGLQAMLRLTQNGPPDFVLLDMRMPRCDGRKTVSAIRNNPDYRGVLLFAVSGAKQEEMNVSIGPQSVDRWFSKPLNPQQLISALRDDLHSESLST